MYKEFVSPVLDRLGRSEEAHVFTRELLHMVEMSGALAVLAKFNYKGERFTDERLTVTLGGVEFENPVIVAAGWDKVGRAVLALWTLGFSGVEVGAVVLYAQPGNPKPRQWVIAPGVAINALGFNSPGAEAVNHNLERYTNSGIPILINVGENRDVRPQDAPENMAQVVEKLYHHASHFVYCVSSPNTPGLRDLQGKVWLNDILQAADQAMDNLGGRKPRYVKVDPDSPNSIIDQVIQAVMDNGWTGIVATNTTNNSRIKAKYGERWGNTPGGLSGDDPDFRRMSTERVSYIYRATGGALEIVGVGAVKDAESALEKIINGARVVQVNVGIRGEGTTIAGRINRGLAIWMDKEGVRSIQEVVGLAHRNRIEI